MYVCVSTKLCVDVWLAVRVLFSCPVTPLGVIIPTVTLSLSDTHTRTHTHTHAQSFSQHHMVTHPTPLQSGSGVTPMMHCSNMTKMKWTSLCLLHSVTLHLACWYTYCICTILHAVQRKYLEIIIILLSLHKIATKQYVIYIKSWM